MDRQDPTKTGDLLRRWRAGDHGALDEILEQDLSWIRAYVSKRLGSLLRRKGETGDFVGEAVLEFLRDGPRFVISDQAQFRALLGQIVTNLLRDEHRWLTAARRDWRRDRSVPRDTSIDLDHGALAVPRPSEIAQAHEETEWLHLALELLDPQDRAVIVLHEKEQLTFVAVAERLGVSPQAVRMRYLKALPRLIHKVKQLQRGELGQVLEEEGAAGPETSI